MCLLRRCAADAEGLQSMQLIPPESVLSNTILDKIESELRLMNVNMAEANDISTLIAFPVMPADLDNDSRKALKQLREKVMERAKNRANP